MNVKRTATYKDSFKIKKATDGSVIIEGWANKAVVDRGGDLIPMSAWNLDNFKKNGMMLFNHDADKPIGKMIDVKATDQGLWIKGRISKSKDPFVSYVRDLVEEGILNAFSVGFDSKEEGKNASGVNEIKQAELYEVSVVTLPMNQDSLFSLSSKSLKGLEYKDVKGKVLREKGAVVAAALQDRIHELTEAGQYDKAKVDQMVMEKAGCDEEMLKQVLAGQVTPVPEAVLAAYSEILGLELEALKELAAGESEQPVEDKPVEPAPVAEEEKSADAEPAEKAKPAVDVIAIQIPKSAAADVEAAAAWAQENGWEAVKVEDEGEYFVAYQVDPAEYGEARSEIELGDGVRALVGIKAAEQKEAGSDQTPEIPPLKVEDVAKDMCSDCVSKWVPKLVDEGKDQDQAVAIAYSKCKDVCGEKKTKDMDEGPLMDQNPMYEQARQTNVLLGTLISEIRTMNEKLERIVVTEPKQEPVSEPAVDVEVSKALDNVNLKLAQLRQKLRKYTEE